MNIDDLVAGPELDALVAEKVMGCKPLRLPHHGRELILCPCELGDYRRPHGRHGDPDDDEIALYSTDIASAWKVVERLKRFGQQSLEWRGFCDEINGFGNVERALWDLNPERICRAALKAVVA